MQAVSERKHTAFVMTWAALNILRPDQDSPRHRNALRACRAMNSANSKPPGAAYSAAGDV